MGWYEDACAARRVIVCGSRSWTDEQHIADVLLAVPNCTIVHGVAPKGADRLAARVALRMELPVEPHPADWKTYGKAAGPIRNEEMAAAGADLCIAFWDGQSRGTLDMMGRCRKHGIPLSRSSALRRILCHLGIHKWIAATSWEDGELWTWNWCDNIHCRCCRPMCVDIDTRFRRQREGDRT